MAKVPIAPPLCLDARLNVLIRSGSTKEGVMTRTELAESAISSRDRSVRTSESA